MKYLFLAIQLLLTHWTFGSKLVSNGTGGGNWSDNSTWTSNYITCVDSIIIVAGDVIDIDDHIDLESCSNPVYVEINGTLNFPNNGDKLKFPSNSKIYGPTTNSIINAPGHDASNKISIIGYGWIFTSNSDIPDLRGPFTFGNAPLPVSLINFSVKKRDQQTEIYWSTATELNNNYFTVFKSKDGEVWEKFKNVEGNGTSTTINNYNIVDDNPFNGVTYYLLSQTDFDGTTVELKTASIKTENNSKKEVAIYPNPVKQNNIITITVDKANINAQSLTLQNLKGQSFPVNIVVKEHNTLTISTNNMTKGVYLIRGSVNGNTFVRKFIIQ